MTYIKLFILTALTFSFMGCASGSKMHSPGSDSPNPQDSKAYEHFFNGAMLDFQDEYEKALIEYYQALLYDSTSAQIRKSIARDLMRLQHYESAAKYLQQALSMNPKDREILNYLAEASYNLQNYQSSIEYYNRLFKLDPYNTTVQNNIIYLYTQLKMDQALLNFYKTLMVYYPDDSSYAIQYAMSNLKQKNVDEAQRVLEKVVTTDSTELNALVVLGNLYEIKKDTNNAIQTYKKILAADPDNEEVLNRVYRILRVKGDWQEIVQLYSSLLTLHPENAQLRLMLAEAYYFQENMDEAQRVVEPVTENATYAAAAYELLGRIAFEKEDFENALKYFTSLTEENPENRFGWLFLAVIYNRQNKFEQSSNVLENALNILPRDADLLSMYGSTLSQQGRDQQALKPLEKSLELDQENISTISSLAAVYDKLQMWNKSDSLYINALKKEPDNALLLNNYSYSLAQRNLQLEKALDLVTRALELDPGNSAYLDTKGWIYYKLGQYDQALEFIGKALESREESAEVLEHMGDVYFKKGQPEQAKKYWQQALEKDPSNTNLAQKIQDL